MTLSLIKHPATLVWTLLMIATALSWWLGADSPFFGENSFAITTGLMLIAFTKIRFVIRYFMEVRHAPVALRLVCDVWVVVICGAILTLYGLGSPAG